VRSVLEQEVPQGYELEVIVAVSDAQDETDLRTAAELGRDRRVSVVTAGRGGPAAARNAGMGAATGAVMAFIDDDCEAQPGWLVAGVAEMAQADFVQGRTRPIGPVGRFDHSLSVDPPSWLWESCNLFVRRSLVDELGGFDEAWNPTGKPHDHWGEDTVWGWKLVHAGARPGFAPDALVLHAVTRRGYLSWAKYHAKIRYFPMALGPAPELRRRFYRGYFHTRRHAVITASLGLLGAGLAINATGRHRLALPFLVGSGALYLNPYLRDLLTHRLGEDVIEYSAAVYGSLRYRRLFL
jgi:glycosyltransferase involved in cell wall biosynthesis